MALVRSDPFRDVDRLFQQLATCSEGSRCRAGCQTVKDDEQISAISSEYQDIWGRSSIG